MVRTYSARVDVYRGGSRLTSLPFDAASPPTITANADSAVHTGMVGEFRAAPGSDLLNDELRPVQIIDGVEYPAGVFIVASYSKSFSEFGEVLHVEAYDRGFVLQSTATENILHLSAGTPYLTAIGQLLTGAGIVQHIDAPNAAVLATDREDWTIGTSYLAIINQLLSEINYAQVWFDATGFAHLEPQKEPTAQNIFHSFDGTSIRSILSHNATETVDIWGKPNVFIAVCQNPDLPEPLVATAVNDAPQSALSTISRGRRIAKTYTVDNIASQAELEVYANRLRSDSMFSSETLTIYTANVPGHGIGDVVAVRHPRAAGIYREIGWSLTLGIGSLMAHNLQRKVLI